MVKFIDFRCCEYSVVFCVYFYYGGEFFCSYCWGGDGVSVGCCFVVCMDCKRIVFSKSLSILCYSFGCIGVVIVWFSLCVIKCIGSGGFIGCFIYYCDW